MSASELSRDDAEPPSRSLLTIDLSIADDIDASAVPTLEQLRLWVEHTLSASRHTPSHTLFELSLSVLDSAAIQALNLEYRNKNAPTNVLSFPSDMPALPADHTAPVLQALGDIVVCQSVVAQEASEQGKPLQHHWAHMVVHSVLHLLGYDHIQSDEAHTMEALEVQVLAELSIPNPYQVSFQLT